MAPSPRVLIAEDDLAFRRVISFSIERRGWFAEAVASGELALQRLASGESYDFLITDHQMPGISGIELVERIRESGNRSLQIVLCTAKGMELNTELLVQKYNLLRVLNKPFSPTLLGTMLMQAYAAKPVQ